MSEYLVKLKEPHSIQEAIRSSSAKRKVVKGGRRGGKTCLASIISVEKFLEGKRILYATPTTDQLTSFWYEVCRSLSEPITAGIYKKNETDHSIIFPGTKSKLRGKTAWNADMLRGDYADLLILDEFQSMSEDTWEEVGAPMLLDNDGDALFIFTPPSLHSRSASKARDPKHAEKLFKKAQQDTSGRWGAFHFTSYDNPHISKEALEEIIKDMSKASFKQEIMAESVEQIEGALWKRELIEKSRVVRYPPLKRIVVGVDPSGSSSGNECGIITAGVDENSHYYIIEDRSLRASPGAWAEAVLTAYNRNQANYIIGEENFGGEMVRLTIQTVANDKGISMSYKSVNASRGKAMRAEPIVALFERGLVHLVGDFPYLEDEMCQWIPGDTRHSPNRLDAMVWAITELVGVKQQKVSII